MSGPLFYNNIGGGTHRFTSVYVANFSLYVSYLLRMFFSLLAQPFQRLLIIQVYGSYRISYRSILSELIFLSISQPTEE